MKTLALASFALSLALLAVPRQALAALTASFDAEERAWSATHVVVASEEEPGEYAVIESWEGDLEPGARVALPDLARLVPEGRRRLGLPFVVRDEAERRRIGAGRLVLFLRRGEDGSYGPAEPEPRPRYSARAWCGAIDVSVAWIDGGQVFALEQIMNPGVPVMIDQSMTEAALRDLVRATLVTRGDLERAAAVVDPERRAAALAPFARDPSRIVSRAALDALGACGEPGVATLARLLREDAATPRGLLIVDALSSAAGRQYEAIVCSILFEETELWRATLPRLEPGWREAGAGGDLARRYDTLLRIVYSLRGGHAGKEARGAIVDLQELWRSQEHLGDGRIEVVLACEEVLARPPEVGCKVRR